MINRIHTIRLAFGTLALVLLMASSTYASILNSALTFNGQKDEIVDESVGLIQDNDVSGPGVGVVSAGDYIQGILWFKTVTDDISTGTPSTVSLLSHSVFAVYSLEVIDTHTSGTNAFVDLKAATGAGSLNSILGTMGMIPTGLNDNPANGLGMANAAIAVFENDAIHSLSEFTTTNAGSLGFFNAGSGKIANVIDNTWSPSLVVGLNTASDPTSPTDNFHQIGLSGVPFGTVTGVDLLQIANIVALNNLKIATNSVASYGNFTGVYSVIEHSFAGNTIFNPIGDTRPSEGLSGPTYTGDVGTALTGLSTVNSSQQGQGWLFADAARFDINAVPEPASVLAWFGLMGAAGLVAARRRKQAK